MRDKRNKSEASRLTDLFVANPGENRGFIGMYKKVLNDDDGKSHFGSVRMGDWMTIAKGKTLEDMIHAMNDILKLKLDHGIHLNHEPGLEILKFQIFDN